MMSIAFSYKKLSGNRDILADEREEKHCEALTMYPFVNTFSSKKGDKFGTLIYSINVGITSFDHCSSIRPLIPSTSLAKLLLAIFLITTHG